MNFNHLLTPQLPIGPRGRELIPAILEIKLHDGDVTGQLPRSGWPYTIRTTPQVAVDPTDPNRVYAVYHDRVSKNSYDIDVFLNRLTKTPHGWIKGSRIRVNQDVVDPNDPDDKDQFHPSVTVDDNARIHVTFYDDRDYDQADGCEDPQDPNTWPTFDVYYAIGTWDQGQLDWEEYELCEDPNDCSGSEAAVDFSIGPDHYEVGEYVGVAWRNVDANTTEVWTSFAGTLASDPTIDDSVIHSSPITFED